MTGKTIQDLIDSRKSEDNEGNQKILDTLKTYGPCSTNQIKNHLIEKARQTARSKYENGEILKGQIEIEVKANSLVRETISRKLGKLVDKGLVIRQGLKYDLSEAAKIESRFFDPTLGKKFGNSLLLALLDEYYPNNKTLESKIKEIIYIFGFHILYSLVESCRPINCKNKNQNSKNVAKDVIIKRWFEYSLDPLQYLNCFISTFSMEFDSKDRERLIEKYTDLHNKSSPEPFDVYVLRKRLLDPLRGSDQYHMQMLYNEAKERKKNYETNNNSLYELKQSRVDEIKRVLNELYPEFFIRAETLTSHNIFESSKEISFKF